mgnify:CR=1 FL=1
MSQLTFKFPFKTNYFEEDFYVSSNNFAAYRLIESWPKWPSNNINIFGPKGCGKTHLANILKKKISSFFINSFELKSKDLELIKNKKCIIIDNYKNNINEEVLYSLINQTNQLGQFLVINSVVPIKKESIELNDLKSRLESFVDIGIDLPTDDLIRVILTKDFSDKQVKIDIKLLEYILKNINRSYEEIFKFIDDIDTISLSTGKAININLVKKVLKNE